MNEDKLNEVNEENEQSEKKTFLDNFLEKIGFERYEVEEDDEENIPQDEEEVTPVKEEVKTTPVKVQPAKVQTSPQPKKEQQAVKPTNNQGGNMKNTDTTSAHMKVFTPMAVGEVREVCDQLRQGFAVVVNTDKLTDADYCRFYDFVYGAAYMIDGKVSQISDTVLILTPASIDITNAVKEEEPEDNVDIFAESNLDSVEIDELDL